MAWVVLSRNTRATGSLPVGMAGGVRLLAVPDTTLAVPVMRSTTTRSMRKPDDGGAKGPMTCAFTSVRVVPFSR
ncbi:hypothetical protein D3C72_2272530 [compost metagenome]